MGKDRNSSRVGRGTSREPMSSANTSSSRNSGQTFVGGSSGHRGSRSLTGRSAGSSAFDPEQQKPSSASKRKTRMILVLGLTLPVLACIIGIAAWAVTTDVVRILPHVEGKTRSSFGPNGKSTNKDDLRHRNDIDILMLPRPKGSTALPTSLKSGTAKPTTQHPVVKSTTDLESRKNISSTSSVAASEILSKLLSSGIGKKGAAQFVVFAPIPENTEIITQLSHSDKVDLKGKEKRKTSAKHNMKHIINDEEDLDMGESMRSEEIVSENVAGLIEPPPKNWPRLNNIRSVHPPPSTVGQNYFGETDPGVVQPRVQATPKEHRQHANRNLAHSGKRSFSQGGASSSGGVKSIGFGEQQIPAEPSPVVFSNRDNGGDPRHPQNHPSGQPSMNVNPSVSHSTSHVDTHQAYSSHVDGLNSFPQNAPFGGSQGTAVQHQSDTLNMQPYHSDSGPKYYAPPPQNFHASSSYQSDSSLPLKLPSSNYEKIGEVSVIQDDQSGSRHHHHHHHYHQPLLDGGDPIPAGSSTNDADRLGSIGIGLGNPRGITLQVGGLRGLLPIGVSGIARSLASALLPLPRLGLNRKIFFGVEVGRGGGFSIG